MSTTELCLALSMFVKIGAEDFYVRGRYAWSYVETFQGVKKGDRVWQLAFGSGFKCCSAVWVALRKNDEKHDAWMDVESY